MKRRIALAALALLCAAEPGRARDPELLTVYRPTRPVTGTIRSWGHGYLRKMMALWEDGFRQYQPGVRFQDELLSSAAAMAGLYSGRADLGVLAREITPPEIAAYEKMTKQRVFPVTVLTGSLSNPDKIMALGVYVHKDNPIARLTFSQLDAIFGAERRRGEPRVIRTWDQFGLAGGWKGSAIQPYSGLAYEAPGYYFSQTVLKGSVLWNCRLRQFDDATAPDGRTIDGYQRVVDALGADPRGIALAGAGYRNANVKMVAIAASDDGPFVAANRETVGNRTYPLARPVRFYINHGPALPPNPAVIEFLRYILSRQGQREVEREGDFLPLDAGTALGELNRLR